jgi:hypothetical protein
MKKYDQFGDRINTWRTNLRTGLVFGVYVFCLFKVIDFLEWLRFETFIYTGISYSLTSSIFTTLEWIFAFVSSIWFFFRASITLEKLEKFRWYRWFDK